MKNIALLCICNLAVLCLFAQSSNLASQADSMLLGFEKAEDDSNKVFLGVDITRKLGASDFKISDSILAEAFKIAYHLNEVYEDGFQKGIVILKIREAGLANYKGNFKMATEILYDALTLADQIPNSDVYKAEIYHNLGMTQRDNKKGFEYYKKVLEFHEVLSPSRLGFVYNNSGYLLNKMDRPKEALVYLQQANKLANEHNEIRLRSYTEYNIGRSNELLEKYDIALKYYRTTLAVSIENNISRLQAYILNSFGEINRKLEQIDSSIYYYKWSIEISKDQNELLMEAYKGLSITYRKAELWEQAHLAYLNFDALKDSISESKKILSMEGIRAKYERESEERQQTESTLAQEKIQSRRNLIQISGIVILSLFLLLLIAFSGKLRLTKKVAEGLVFILFILLFEFMLVVMDPYIDVWSDGQVAVKLAINSLFALIIFFGHQFSEDRLKTVLLKKSR